MSGKSCFFKEKKVALAEALTWTLIEVKRYYLEWMCAKMSDGVDQNTLKCLDDEKPVGREE